MMKYCAIEFGASTEDGSQAHCDECLTKHAGDIIESANTLDALLRKLGRKFPDMEIELKEGPEIGFGTAPSIHGYIELLRGKLT